MPMAKGQSAIEFMSTYSFMFLIVALVLFVVFFLANVPSKTVPAQCSSYGGISCIDAEFMNLSPSGSKLILLLTSTQPGIFAINSFNAVLDNVQSANGICSRPALQAGNQTSCVAFFDFNVVFGVLYSGTFNITGNYCAPGAGGISGSSCQIGAGYAYGGALAVQASQAPAVHYVKITLTNSQGSATPAPFQQNLTIDSLSYQTYINPTWSNVEFTTGPDATGAILNAWVESNPTNTATSTTVWVSIPGGIGAGSTNTIYMNFYPTSYTIMSNPSSPTGEAPQLSPSYGLYDNGGDVFNFYSNFEGVVLNPPLADADSSQLTVSNGITVLPQSADAGWSREGVVLKKNYAGTNTVFDAYCEDASPTGSVYAGGIYLLNGDATDQYSIANSLVFNNEFIGGGTTAGISWQNPQGTVTSNAISFAWSASTYYVLSLLWNNGIGSALIDYANAEGPQTTYNPTSLYLGLGLWSGASQTQCQWVRTRAYPPGGVMPTASFGSVT